MQRVDVINKDIENGDASEHSNGNELLSVTAGKRTYTIDRNVYWRAEDVVKGYSKGRSSMIWGKSPGFEIIDLVTRSKHYYCRPCIDVEKRKVTLFSTASGTRSILEHWRKIHFTDEDGTPIPKGNIQEALVN
jgi:hypothetical protein